MILAMLAVVAAPGSAGAARRPVVLVVGDSLTVGAERRGQLSEKLKAAGFDPVVVGENGISANRAPALIERARRERRVDVVVVALGTNDAMVGEGGASFARQIQKVRRAVGTLPVLWVDVHATAFAGQAKLANRELATAARSWKELRVLRWSQTPGARLLIHDGVHLSARGYQLRAAFVTQAVTELVG